MNNNHEIILKLNEYEKIVLKLVTSISDIHCCSEAQLVFYKHNHQNILHSGSIRSNMESLAYLLNKALRNELHLHDSIKQDIGYLDNEQFQNKPGFIYEKFDGRDVWVGDKYNVWSSAFQTWIYNNAAANIIFEITPFYSGNWGTPARKASCIPYDEWIKNYKPFLITKIPKEVAREWLRQSNEILETIEKNVQRMKAEHEASK